jgi:DNA helicase IV
VATRSRPFVVAVTTPRIFAENHTVPDLGAAYSSAFVPHGDVAEEQRYLDHAYRCLDTMRERTARAASITDSAAQAVDSSIAQWHLGRRLATLDGELAGLSFGRLDHDDGDTWYVGRRHVEDAHGDPVVVDWRAGVATPFYRATAADALGLRRRRRFMMTGRRLDDIDDEVFDDPDSVYAARHGGIPDPLLAELERERTGEMRDIVATIQAEQDVVIRAPLETCLVVQGAPGTGKTAVGLHRAAFLLYEHRELLDRTGVLVVGPNPVFLRYIAQVLPSLGETAVRQTTIERLVAGSLRVRAFDDDTAARVKGDGRMADVLARAVRAGVSPPLDDVEVTTHWGTVRLTADAVRAAIDDIAGRGVPHNVGRGALRTQLTRLAWRELLRIRGEDVTSPDDFERDLRGNRVWQRWLDRTWPAVGAAALVRRVLSGPTALRAAAEGILDASEQQAILRKPVRRADDEPWTVADLVLVDEAEALTVGPPRAYGHVVVDEAQDLSTMAVRALARRCPSRSMTVLGDLAQATAPAAQRSWLDVAAALGVPERVELTELDLGYRVPAPIIEFANRLLPEAAPGVRPARSVREVGRAPVVVPAADVDALVAALGELTAERADRWTTVGVVAVEGLHERLRQVLPATDAVALLVPEDAKGLEFDAVVVVEPAQIAAGDARGARLLYVALTRAVQELVVVHATPLPPALAAVS